MFIPGNRKSRIINRKLNYRKVHGWLNSELFCVLALFFRGCNQPNLSTFIGCKGNYFLDEMKPFMEELSIFTKNK